MIVTRGMGLDGIGDVPLVTAGFGLYPVIEDEEVEVNTGGRQFPFVHRDFNVNKINLPSELEITPEEEEYVIAFAEAFIKMRRR